MTPATREALVTFAISLTALAFGFLTVMAVMR